MLVTAARDLRWRRSVTGEYDYVEGDVFAVPLDHGAGYGVGLVVRADGCGVVLGYFFGSARWEALALGELAFDAAVVHWFGDLSLVRGEWPLLGRFPHWRQAAWPVPAFGMCNVLLEQAFRLKYPYATFGDVREVPVTRAEAVALPCGALFGAGLVESALTELLRTGA
jgi:hypothetical protein